MADKIGAVAEGWGKYDSQGEVGRGPSGRVFRAYDKNNRRQVAIKELAPALTGSAPPGSPMSALWSAPPRPSGFSGCAS